jgi:hypothetical protein
MEVTLVPFCSITASIEISNASLVGSSGRTHRPSFLLDRGATPAAATIRRLAGPVLTLTPEESYVSSVGTCVGGIASSWAECETRGDDAPPELWTQRCTCYKHSGLYRGHS